MGIFVVTYDKIVLYRLSERVFGLYDPLQNSICSTVSQGCIDVNVRDTNLSEHDFIMGKE
jgi:hypothetical protein